MCQLVPNMKHLNQNARLCASVLGSSYFSGKIKLPGSRNNKNRCYLHPISFQTDYGKGIARTERQVYQEWMIQCKADDAIHHRARRSKQTHFYISRAYNSNELFVYRIHSINGHQRAYLENVSTRISIVDTENVGDKSDSEKYDIS